jgi:hypothetical protein
VNKRIRQFGILPLAWVLAGGFVPGCANPKTDEAPSPSATDFLATKAEALRARYPESAVLWKFEPSAAASGRECEMLITYPAKKAKDDKVGVRIMYEAKASYSWNTDTRSWELKGLVETKGPSVVELGGPFIALVALADLKSVLE